MAKVPFVIIRPKECCGRTRKNKFYRAILQDLPKNHASSPGVRVTVARLPLIINRVNRAMRSVRHGS